MFNFDDFTVIAYPNNSAKIDGVKLTFDRHGADMADLVGALEEAAGLTAQVDVCYALTDKEKSGGPIYIGVTDRDIRIGRALQFIKT